MNTHPPASAVPQRNIKAVTAHVQRNYHPLAKLGVWEPSENDRLATLVSPLAELPSMSDVAFGIVLCSCLGHNGHRLAGRLVVQQRIVRTGIEISSLIENLVLVVCFVFTRKAATEGLTWDLREVVTRRGSSADRNRHPS